MDLKAFSLTQNQKLALSGAAGLAFLAIATPALAHHPFGGQTPANAMEGFLSGLGHPVIGLDHLAFVIAAGLLATVLGRGFMMPVVFVLASLVGTGLHLMNLNLPAPEFFISGSVLLFGVLLALKYQPNNGIVTGLAAVAGLFHGYAYGEAIIGANMGALVAYLLGFATIQTGIALVAYWMAKRLGASSETGALNLRFAGFTLAGVGAAFLSGVFLG
jgi:urease accessory protein